MSCNVFNLIDFSIKKNSDDPKWGNSIVCVASRQYQRYAVGSFRSLAAWPQGAVALTVLGRDGWLD